MKFTTRCLPLGSLPYDNLEAVSRMEVKLFEHFPFLPFLPNLDKDDNITKRTLHNIPCIKIKDGKPSLKGDLEHYKKALYLPTALNTPASRLWAAKAAEAIYSIAEKRPVKQHIENAQSALNMLEKYQIIPAGTAETRTNILKRARFRPRISK